MSLSSRSGLRSFFCLFSLLSAACAAQASSQFSQPQVEPTGGRVSSLVAGSLQGQTTPTNDILYVNAPTGSGVGSSVLVGQLLNQQGLQNLGPNQITFPGVTNVAAALADFNGDHITDYAFALTPTTPGGTNFCLYLGNGAGLTASAYNGGNTYPAAGKSGCTTLPITGAQPPTLQYIATATPASGSPEVFLEDSANSTLYVFSTTGAQATGGILTGITLTAKISLTDGAGPMYTADLNGDGIPDLVVNGQTNLTATVLLGGANGTFAAGVPYTFGGHVHSMLLQDMNNDGHLDMVIENDTGIIQIYPGSANGTFSTNPIGTTPTNVQGGYSGYGGHLAAIDPTTLNILTTTPIGLSVLQHGTGNLDYTLGGIYNIGPGRTSFALAPFLSTSPNLDLAVDSAEGVAIAVADTHGGFQSAFAYSTYSPALSTTVGKFRTIGNPNNALDIVAAVGSVQSILLDGNGTGGFVPTAVTNSYGNPNTVPANTWSNVLSGDFFGLGNLDILYSLTGKPLPAPGTSANSSGLYIQIGNGNGSFQPPAGLSFGQPANNNFYGESITADFNGDGLMDIANLDADYDDVLLGQSNGSLFSFGLNQPVSGNTPFNLAAAGIFKGTRITTQDLIVQQGAALIPYLNNGSGTGFAAQPALAATPSPSQLVASSLLLTDLDGDNNGDVVAVYYNPNSGSANPAIPGQLYIWYGNGNGTFQPPQTLALTRNDYLGAVADMNNDGKPDILLADGSVVSILYNQGSRVFKSDFGTGCSPCAEQHFLAGQGINSLSLADVNGDGKPDLIVANGGLTLSNPIALGGTTAPTLTLVPSAPDVDTGGVTVLLNAFTTSPVTATLKATPEPSTFQATFTLTATITPSSGVALPTGTVQFSIDGVQEGSPVALTPGTTTSTATYIVAANNGYAVGTHTLSATYSGDTNNSALTFTGTHQITSPAASPVTGSVSATPEPSAYQTQFILTASITPAAGVAAPTGTVQFSIDGAPVGGPIPVTAGSPSSTAMYTIPPNNNYTVSTHTLTAAYSGDPANAPNTFTGSHTIGNATLGSTVTSLDLCVGPSVPCPSAPASATPPFSALLTMIYGQVFNGTTSVQSFDGNPLTGTTTLYDLYNGVNSPLCTLNTSTGGACAPSVGTGELPGVHVLTSVYSGDPLHSGSTSPMVTLTVTPDTVTSIITSSQEPAAQGQPVTFTATLTGIYGPPTIAGSGPVGYYLPPAGVLTFYTGTTVIGTGTLTPNANGISSSATFTTSSLPLGINPISISYPGSASFLPYTSPVLDELITPLGAGSFTLTVTPNPVNIGVGYTTGLTVTVSPGYSQAVTLSCGELPYEATCNFSAPVIPAGGGSVTMFVGTTAPHTCGTTQPYFLGSNRNGPALAPFALPALAGVLAIFLPGRRRWLRLLVVVIVATGAMQMTGCGHCTDLGTRPNTYTIQVTGSAPGTGPSTPPEVQTVPVTINVVI